MELTDVENFAPRPSNQRLAQQISLYKRDLQLYLLGYFTLKIMTETTREDEVQPLKNLKPVSIMTTLKTPGTIQEGFIELTNIKIPIKINASMIFSVLSLLGTS